MADWIVGIQVTDISALNATDFEILPLPLTTWCDRDFNRVIDSEEQVDLHRLWDFGEEGDYPAITCAPGGVETQRKGFQRK